MLTGLYLTVTAVVASLFGAGAWLASTGHSVRAQRLSIGGAAFTAIALLAPSHWLLLSLIPAVAAFIRPLAVTHLAAAGGTAVAFAGVLFLPGADALARRSRQAYAGTGMNRAYIASLKSDLRNIESLLEVYFAETGRYDAAILAGRREVFPSGGNQIVIAPAIDRWHAWAHSRIADKACDHGPDQPPTCPVTVPVDSAATAPVRVFAPAWVRDSLPADHWAPRLLRLRPREFATDQLLAWEELRITTTDSGWVAERELAGWHCVTGTGKLAPVGVASGGFVCHIVPVTWGGAADSHAH